MKKHPYFTTCPYCGAHLDPGERCDCAHAAPGGYPSGNCTSTETEQVQIVQPPFPGLPPIVFYRGKHQST